MNETKRTPGPWKVAEWTTGSGRRYISVQTDYPESPCNGSRSVACMTGSYYTQAGRPDYEAKVVINRANAKLIAAAPELLDALIQLREWVRHPGVDDSPANEVVIAAADAAIAAATGD